MKTTSLKTIYLTADELKQAIVEYLAKEHEDLAQHLYDNECEMVWGQDGKEFLVSIDGEIDDGGNTPERVEEQIEWLKKTAEQKEINKMVDQVKSAAIKASHKVIEDHKEALQKFADNPVNKTKTFYMCGVGFQHDPKIMLYRAVEKLKFHKPCWKECGIVKVSVTEDEWVEEQDLFREKSTKWYNCAHCDAGYMDQECTCDNNQEGKE